MSFLDNLENSLKSLENVNERGNPDEKRRREREKQQTLAAGPHAEELKRSPFMMALLDSATRIAFGQRTKVNMIWLGSTLRLDAKERRLELRPTPAGVIAVFLNGRDETHSEPVDLSGDAEQLAQRWLSS